MKQILTILILGTFLSSQTIKACCIGEYVQVFPRSSYVSSNSSFLINFSEGDFNLKNNISDLVFTAITTKGKRYKLTVLETNFSGTTGQVFLKVKSKLNIGDTISIEVNSIISDTLTGKTKDFSRNLSYRKWVVQYKMDKELPTWTDDSISYTTHDSRNSSAPGYGVIFKVKIKDNLIYDSKNKASPKSTLPIFYSVTLDEQKFICAAENNDPSISYSICGSNFNFEVDKTYTAIFTAIDASGNYSKNTKTILFTTTSKRDEMEILR
ncbi:MAG: hypothetical protein ACOYMA_11200 [Bacteroidia bacterium]